MATSFSKAQAQAINSGFLDNLASDQNFQAISFKGAAKLLFDLAAEFAEGARKNLESADRTASGNLSDSIIPLPLRVMGTTIIADVKALDYFDYINKGVKGTQGGSGSYSFKSPHPSKAMVTDIRKWLIKEGIKFRNTKVAISSREKRRKTFSEANKTQALAYAVATNVKKKGIAPSYFWDKAEEKLRANIRERLGKAFVIDIVQTLKQDFK